MFVSPSHTDLFTANMHGFGDSCGKKLSSVRSLFLKDLSRAVMPVMEAFAPFLKNSSVGILRPHGQPQAGRERIKQAMGPTPPAV